ncbi:MAG: nuclear transport factor 2 family protein [Anaerolineae bacterium]|nr:nuclear transport factor 2 family protein [Anaerolineae bacterium]MBL8104631.1 nuclear transport factor 2 family protein [Anaerolineales bacterium]MCC7189575.1 nuclear transport factor 2 family protein [Anaerolineales bacterium]
MNILTHAHFQQWMETYGRASAEDDPFTSANLFAKDAAYYETPFAEPMIGRDAIFDYWNKGAQNLRDKESTFEILSVNGHSGMARWQSQFTVIESGKRLALDCVFIVEFDDDGLCQTFREWWRTREV